MPFPRLFFLPATSDALNGGGGLTPPYRTFGSYPQNCAGLDNLHGRGRGNDDFGGAGFWPALCCRSRGDFGIPAPSGGPASG